MQPSSEPEFFEPVLERGPVHTCRHTEVNLWCLVADLDWIRRLISYEYPSVLLRNSDLPRQVQLLQVMLFNSRIEDS
jgi:hypothetical protein